MTKCWSITTCKWHSCIAASCSQLSVIQNVVYRIMKNAMSSAPTFSFDHVKVISRTALFLMEAAHKAGTELSSTLSQRAHTTPSAENDVFFMSAAINASGVAAQVEGRKGKVTKPDPREKGLEKLEQGWLKAYLTRSCDIDSYLSEDCDSQAEYELEPEVLIEDVEC